MKRWENNEVYLKSKKYIFLTWVIIFVSLIFITVFELQSGQYGTRSSHELEKVILNLKKGYEEGAVHTNDRERVYLGGGSGELVTVLEFLKYAPVQMSGITELDAAEPGSYVVMDASWLSENWQELQIYCENKDLKVILYNLTEKEMDEEAYCEFLGIKKYVGTKKCKGIRFLDGFWTDVSMTEKKYQYQALDLEIENGRQVYITEYSKDYEKNKVIPLLYRQIYGNSELYVVNGDLMEVIPQGILQGIFMQKETYMYPVINASFTAITTFPLLSNENEKELRNRYSRNVKQFTEDILLPDIGVICDNLGQKPSVLACFHIKDGKESTENLDYIFEEIPKMNGEVGIMVKDSEAEKWLRKERKDIEIGSFMLSGSESEPVCAKPLAVYLEKGGSKVLPVLSIDDSGTVLTLVYDFIEKEPKMTLQYWASVYGYGLSALGTDMEKAYYPDDEEWNEVSKRIAKNVENTVLQIKTLEPLTLYETGLRVQQYQMQESDIQYTDEGVKVDIDGFTGNAEFILKTDKEIKEVQNGTAKAFGEGMYLVSFTKENGRVILEPSKLEYAQ